LRHYWEYQLRREEKIRKIQTQYPVTVAVYEGNIGRPEVCTEECTTIRNLLATKPPISGIKTAVSHNTFLYSEK
jgi:hypothetical protein